MPAQLMAFELVAPGTPLTNGVHVAARLALPKPPAGVWKLSRFGVALNTGNGVAWTAKLRRNAKVIGNIAHKAGRVEKTKQLPRPIAIQSGDIIDVLCSGLGVSPAATGLWLYLYVVNLPA